MIYIHKGDDTDFNDNSFLTFTIVTEKDLTGWQAKFILNGLEKTFDDITSKSFELHYSDEETSQFKLGKTTNELKLIDEEGKIKTIAKNIDISVTNEVIENESQLINLPILKDEGIDINISLSSNSGNGGGTSNHFELLYRDMANQHPISAITSLQETLDNKANKDEIPSVDGFITNDELEKKGYLTEHQDLSNLATKDELTNKQDVLISGTNIKTINNESILGSGNIEIKSASGSNYSMFDTRILDYILSSEESNGWVEQGKYVAKTVYPDFYNKCYEEFTNEENSMIWIKSNVIPIGSVQDNKGILSGFSGNNYTNMPSYYSGNITSFEFVFCATTEEIGTQRSIFGQTTTNQATMQLQILRDGKIELIASSIGSSSWDVGLRTLNAVTTGSTYWIKTTFNNTTGYEFYLSENGDDYDLQASNATTTAPKWTEAIQIGNDVANAGAFWVGKIDLNESYINVNGSRWWSGTDKTIQNHNGHRFYEIENETPIENVYAYGIDKTNELILLPTSKNIQDYEHKYYRVL